MWAFVERALGGILNARYARDHAQPEPNYHRPAIGTDTVVFVHGLHGHVVETWAQFPELLAGDPELPVLDILLWGYRGTILPGASLISTVSAALMGFVRKETEPEAEVYFVGHSLGGLVILRGLCDEAKGGRARSRPLQVTRHVHLYASPVCGSGIATAIEMTVGVIPRMKYFISGHLRELKQGDFCNKLLGDIAEHIYQPRINPGDESRKVEISIEACIAERDVAVQMSSAEALFRAPPPTIVLGATHTSVKEPESRRDIRYRAFQKVLVERYTSWFHEISKRVLNHGDRVAREEVRRRALVAAEERLRNCRPARGNAVTDERIEELLAIAMDYSRNAPTLRFGRAMDLALIDLKRRGR